jgi:3-amino-4-hydroxybenzoic acid synthase
MDTQIALQNVDITMAKRDRIKLHRIEGERNRNTERDARLLWYDTRAEGDRTNIFARLSHMDYTGIVLYPDNFESLTNIFGSRLQKILHLENSELLEATSELLESDLIISSPSLEVLEKVRALGLRTCLRAYVDDASSLESSIEKGNLHDVLMVSFRDPTNIPLELVIASLQGTDTLLVKEITDPNDVDDAIVTLGVMEVGADGVLFSPKDSEKLDSFVSRLKAARTLSLPLEVGRVTRAVPIGMGYRSCIDLATLFTPTEGMIIGSTSQGGILCCPEVFFLPYMELRPFRVNAGAVHSYVYNVGNRTDYMTELRAGSSVMVVDSQGKVRQACVGRMKTEVRPLRLIEVEFEKGKRVNVIMQDDWHVRIFSDKGLPLNITELRTGDTVLGHCADPGRHVGIKVDEHIIEN